MRLREKSILATHQNNPCRPQASIVFSFEFLVFSPPVSDNLQINNIIGKNLKDMHSYFFVRLPRATFCNIRTRLYLLPRKRLSYFIWDAKIFAAFYLLKLALHYFTCERRYPHRSQNLWILLLSFIPNYPPFRQEKHGNFSKISKVLFVFSKNDYFVIASSIIPG